MSRKSEQDLRSKNDYVKEKYNLFEESGEEYEVDKIVDMRTKYGENYYLIKWAGYDDMTWEPEHHLHCQQKLEIFLNKLGCGYNPKSKENTSFTTNNNEPSAKKQKLVKHLPRNNYTNADRRSIDELWDDLKKFEAMRSRSKSLPNANRPNNNLRRVSKGSIESPPPTDSSSDMDIENEIPPISEYRTNYSSPSNNYTLTRDKDNYYTTFLNNNAQQSMEGINTYPNQSRSANIPKDGSHPLDVPQNNSHSPIVTNNGSQVINASLNGLQTLCFPQNNFQATNSFLNNLQTTATFLNSSQVTNTFLNNSHVLDAPQNNLQATDPFLNNSQATVSFLNSSQATNTFSNSSQSLNVPQNNPHSHQLNKSPNNLEITEQKESNELSLINPTFQGKWTGGFYKMVRSQKIPIYISRVHIDPWPRMTPDLELFDALKSLDKIVLQNLHPLNYVFNVFNLINGYGPTFVSMVFVSGDHEAIEREKMMHKWSERASFTILNDWVLYFLPNSGNINQMLHIPRVECNFILLRVNKSFFTNFENEAITINSNFINDKDFKDYKTYTGAEMNRAIKLPENLYKSFSESNYCLLSPPDQAESFDMECYMNYIGAKMSNLEDVNLDLILVKICPQEILIPGGIIMPTLKALTEFGSLAYGLKEYVNRHNNWVIKIHPYILQMMLNTFSLLTKTDKSSAQRNPRWT
nr:8002_t:CDS:10 [Entrophospora candida]